jgi:hypothetical protein
MTPSNPCGSSHRVCHMWITQGNSA